MTLSTKKARSLTNKPFQRRSDLPVELSSDQRFSCRPSRRSRLGSGKYTEEAKDYKGQSCDFCKFAFSAGFYGVFAPLAVAEFQISTPAPRFLDRILSVISDLCAGVGFHPAMTWQNVGNG